MTILQQQVPYVQHIVVQVLLVTGATGVMMASYVVPIVNHLVLYFGRSVATCN